MVLSSHTQKIKIKKKNAGVNKAKPMRCYCHAKIYQTKLLQLSFPFQILRFLQQAAGAAWHTPHATKSRTHRAPHEVVIPVLYLLRPHCTPARHLFGKL